MNAVTNENTTLYYREGSSDKVYQCSIEPRGDLFVVNFAYGRRGSTLNTGTKTSSPVDYEMAKRTFDKLVREKMAKGYSPGESGTPYQHTEKEQQSTGILPQLLNPIDEEDVRRLIEDPAWCLQEKMDGRRVLLMKVGPVISGVNRKGLTIGLPETVMKNTGSMRDDFIMDGEAIGDVLYAFDLLAVSGQNLQSQGYHSRLVSLMNLIAGHQLRYIQLVATAFDAKGKQSMLDQLRREKKEGVVFKELNAPYTPGRPASGGAQLKHKFYATLSAVVSKVNQQRSVEVQLRDGEKWKPCGNVTIPPNHTVPKPGEVVEIRYLYAMPGSGALYQPVYLGARSDINPNECVVAQLKFKSEKDEL